jgi:hypothetical protein
MSDRIGFNVPVNKTAFGGYGFNELVNGDSIVITDRFAFIQAKGDTVFAFDNDVDLGITTDAAYTLLDGEFLYGYFHNISVASGKLLAYYTQG